ncbi:hypothetical protein WMF31_05100 [Sorangium sp. So ce1036]|uniref:hypothetical protein n=1 Tax=Sorangium sp. So ce1036 TaxID=3133328 RepID=UPI003F0A3771
MDTKQNGAGSSPISVERSAEPIASAAAVAPPPPPAVEDLAEGCVRFVERALGVRLDYRPETLPVLDHYLEEARRATSERVEALPVVAHMAGVYFGEVIRRRYASWWRMDGDDPTYWQIELEPVYLAFSPVLFIREALTRDRAAEAPRDLSDAPLSGDPAALELEEDDREAVAARLAELPPVSEDEYYAPSTRLEVIDIAVDAIRSRRLAAGEETDAALEPDDYARGDD